MIGMLIILEFGNVYNVTTYMYIDKVVTGLSQGCKINCANHAYIVIKFTSYKLQFHYIYCIIKGTVEFIWLYCNA